MIMDNIWKKNAKLLLIIVLDIFIISGATYAATTMYTSNTVSYDNTISGLDSDNVQGALDRLYSAATDYTSLAARVSALEAIVPDDIYPVGSIYTSINSTNPSTLFGGTWVAFGTGKTLVGVDTSDTSFDTVEETGGAKTKSYTPVGTVGNTMLTVDQIPSHNHSIPALSGSTTAANNVGLARSAGAHTHKAGTLGGSGVMEGNNGNYMNAYYTADIATSSAGAHTHKLDIPSLTVTTTASTSGSKGGGGSHNHTFTGTAADINVVQPYITVYMWKRTA